MSFQQPAWVQESGLPYPGAEDAAEIIRKAQDESRVEELAKTEALKTRARRKGQQKADEEEKRERVIRASSLADIVPQNNYWLWHHRIPLGEVTLVAGRGGIGKSLFLCTLVAWVTRGDARGQFDGEPRNVIFVANEDSYEKTVVPRLLAAGADLSRVFRLDIDHAGVPGKLMLPEDNERLTQAIKDIDAIMVVLDPVSSNMADRDRNSPEVRASYERLRLCAEKNNVAIVGNAHTRKGQSADLLEAIMGSSEIGNVARAAIGVVRDPDADVPTVILSQCKNNNGPTELKSYTYQVQERTFPHSGTILTAPMLIWGESTEKHVNDVLGEPVNLVSKSDVDECREWLHDYLMQNPGAERKSVMSAAQGQRFKDHTVKRAAGKLGVNYQSTGFPRVTTWHLPVSQSEQSEQIQVPTEEI